MTGFLGSDIESTTNNFLVGGFNPFEKYSSNWIMSPSRGETKKYLKPPPSFINAHDTTACLSPPTLLVFFPRGSKTEIRRPKDPTVQNTWRNTKQKILDLNYTPRKTNILGMVIQLFNRNPFHGYKNPYYWVDDHPLLYGNNGSLDPSTHGLFKKNISKFGISFSRYLFPGAMFVFAGVFGHFGREIPLPPAFTHQKTRMVRMM